ncbi:hypothetical protein bwei_3120 [Bacillus mycoides]|nr:hypothetical protein bwei_3120 [Bacillus mycoides]
MALLYYCLFFDLLSLWLNDKTNIVLKLTCRLVKEGFLNNFFIF